MARDASSAGVHAGSMAQVAVNVLAIPLIDRVAMKGESDTLQRAGSCAL
jgi:hypothetical protein